jgi:chromate transporter
MNTLLLLMFEFIKTGLFAFGGGLATIPFLYQMSQNYGWFDLDTLTTMIAVSQSTPGPMGINMATYCGYTTYGVLGGVVTSLSLVLPSLIIVCLIASQFEKFKNSKLVQAVFTGLRPAVVGFVISAILGIYISALFNVELFTNTKNIIDLLNYKAIIIMVLLLIINKYRKLNPIIVIMGCGALGIILGL